MIRKVFIFRNGNVVVFDHQGKQVSELQAGSWKDMARRILDAADADTVFYDARAKGAAR